MRFALALLAALLPAAALAQTLVTPPDFKTPTRATQGITKGYVDTGLAGKVPEAPNDGVYYTRRNGQWIASPGGGGGATTGRIIRTPATSPTNDTTFRVISGQPQPDGFGFDPNGAYLERCSNGGCFDGPHMYAANMFNVTTNKDANAQEQGLTLSFVSKTGENKKWTASTAYSVGKQVRGTAGSTCTAYVGGTLLTGYTRCLYEVVTAGTSGAGGADSGGPSGDGQSITDGSVVWKSLGPGDSAKTGFDVACSMEPGAAATWCNNFNFSVKPGIGEGIAYGEEKDCNNGNEDSGPGSRFQMSCTFYGGGGTYEDPPGSGIMHPGTHPMFAYQYFGNGAATVAGGYGAHFGLYFSGDGSWGGSVIKDATIRDDSNSSYALWLGAGRHHQGVIRDDSNSATGISLSGNYSTAALSMSPGGCASTEGHQATDGNQTWEPTCFGVFASQGQDLIIYPTRGMALIGGVPDINHAIRAPLAVQAQSRGDVVKEQNGIAINMDVVGGPESAARQGTTNTVGLFMSGRQRPGPSGQRPPTFWGLNTDIHVGPGSGNTTTFGWEADMNNFNADCAVAGSCLMATVWFNGIMAYPQTAWLYSGGGTTTNYSGTVTTSGSTVTRVSGGAFGPGMSQITIAGSKYKVAYVDANHLSVTAGAITQFGSAVAYTGFSAMTHNGLLFADANGVSDNDLQLNTSAINGVAFNGDHYIALNTSGDAAPYALATKAAQNICFNGLSDCMSYSAGINSWLFQTSSDQGSYVARISTAGDATFNGAVTAATVAGNGFVLNQGNKFCMKGGTDGCLYSGSGSNNFSFDMGGYRALTVIGGSQNGVTIASATAGNGPQIAAAGADTNITLNLKAKGSNAFGFQNDTGSQCTLIPGSASLSCSSDERLKRGIHDAAPALPQLLDLRIRDFMWRSTSQPATGVIAQEVARDFPGMVHQDDNGMLRVDAPNPWVLVKAIQELKADNDNLRRRVERLERRRR